MTTSERNFPLQRLIQQCHRSAQDPGRGCYCFRGNLPPASCETVARVTENTGLCDVNVIESDNSLQALQEQKHGSGTETKNSEQQNTNETRSLSASRKADLEIDNKKKDINSFHWHVIYHAEKFKETLWYPYFTNRPPSVWPGERCIEIRKLSELEATAWCDR